MKEALLSIIKDENRIITDQIDPQYLSDNLGRKKGNPILLKGTDFGVEFGIGCDIYLPFFKLCPELKFSFGLVDLLEKDRSDLTDPELIKYPNSLSKATSRMVTLTFNFE